MTPLRRRDKLRPEDEAWRLFERAPAMHLASTTPEGAPLLRTLHGVVLDGAIAFHSAPKGEKLSCVGRPAVVSVEELVADIPSWFIDPVRACPATSLYRSAMAHGALEPVDSPEEKARALDALMRRFQPSGGYRPITAEDPLYTKALRGVSVLCLRPERVVGKAALWQRKPAALRAQVIGKLLERGLPGDAEAAQAMLDVAPLEPWPEALRGPAGLRFHPAPGPERVEACVDLVTDMYWNQGVPREALRRAHLGSSAWVAAEAPDGRVVATARALCDGGKLAYVADVVVAPGLRGQGVGRALIAQLVAHPALRGARSFILHTVDAGAFYARLGFVEMADRESWALRR
ncbi:MAG: GNAT family N-acetyltransferase [Alphaproteobacteria bacterium]|nr:GNAT family N-acetyltransferase [Alphaproteobacteria bacterium]